MVRTRFAPSPTGYMHIGNLRTALYEYLIAKSSGGQFILRIEDTDQERYVEGATDVIYQTLATTGLIPDESPRNPGPYGPYIQSERKGLYLDYAKELVEKGQAYYCFCTKERLDSLRKEAGAEEGAKYDRHCLHLAKEEVEKNLQENIPYVIRQKMPTEGKTTFHDEVFGDITVENTELDDQILIKSDGLPTYNFANVVDDHLMKITHVIRGTEYLSSTPKYNLLYTAFGWDVPIYIHVPAVMKNASEKLSKRNGDASFQDLVAQGFLPEAIINYIALLGWSPDENREIYSLSELAEHFSIKGLSKSPAIFDIKKLTWMNGEYIKNMDFDAYFSWVAPVLKENICKPLDLQAIARLLQGRLELLTDVPQWVDFFDALPTYDNSLYIHKKMKTTPEIALDSLESVLPLLSGAKNWTEEALHDSIMNLVAEKGIKNGQMLWPIRTALSGKPSSPGGAFDLFILLGKEESLKRIEQGISQLKAAQ